jgi:hypothetical protein
MNHITGPVKQNHVTGNWAYVITNPDDAGFVRVVSFRSKWAADRSLSLFAAGDAQEALRGAKVEGELYAH